MKLVCTGVYTPNHSLTTCGRATALGVAALQRVADAVAAHGARGAGGVVNSDVEPRPGARGPGRGCKQASF